MFAFHLNSQSILIFSFAAYLSLAWWLFSKWNQPIPFWAGTWTGSWSIPSYNWYLHVHSVSTILLCSTWRTFDRQQTCSVCIYFHFLHHFFAKNRFKKMTWKRNLSLIFIAIYLSWNSCILFNTSGANFYSF